MESGWISSHFAHPFAGAESMSTILIIDDDSAICHVLSRVAGKMGHVAVACATLAEGEQRLAHMAFDVVLLDVHLPDGNGLEGLERLSAVASPGPRPDIIVMTGFGVPDDAELAVRHGALDYLQKGSTAQMAEALEHALQYRTQRQAGEPAPAAIVRDGIVGESPQLARCLDAMARMARGEGSVLLCGETGTGKELFAQALHRNSARAQGPFVIVDCAGLPDNLVESLLFGHVRGAFTGADRDAEGYVRQAHKGTLFLDEVGELPLGVQSAFLRVLQERAFRPVGSAREERSDFRLVAATNRDLDTLVREGAFRADLLYRLRGSCLQVPPLREREGDVALIAEHYIALFCSRLGLEPKRLSPDLQQLLERHIWPGNVRELVNAVDYAVNAARYEPTLFHPHLPTELRATLFKQRLSLAPRPEVPDAAAPANGTLPPLALYREQVLRQAERQYIDQLMSQTGNDIREACRLAELSQSRLYALLKKHGSPTPGWQR